MKTVSGLLFVVAALLCSSPAAAQDEAAATADTRIPDRMLGTLYATDTFYTVKYVLTWTRTPEGVKGDMRATEGAIEDARQLLNVKLLIEEDGATYLVGDFLASYRNPNYYCTPCDPHQEIRNGSMRGSFRARFFSSSGDTYMVEFKESELSDIDPLNESSYSFHRTP
jgi:hypothetical protein